MSQVKKAREKLGIGELAGVKVDLDARMVLDGSSPLSKRHYWGSRIDKAKIKCFVKGKYRNVEMFQPVIYDHEEQVPTFDPKWIQWDNPDNKGRKMIRINYPRWYKEWWYEQRRRCLEGYTIGGVTITGEYYFYLNFWRIRGKRRGSGFIVPRFIDLQKQLFDLVEQAREADANLLTLKRRQIGFSECFAAIMAYDYTFYPMGRGLIVGGQDTYSINTFNKVVCGLDAFMSVNAGREFYKRRKSGANRSDFIECGFIDKNGTNIGFLSQVEAITTLDNVQAANGKTPTFCLMEEAGINRHLKTVYDMILPAIKEQEKQDGRMIAICGTGGEMDAGAAQLMEMFYNPTNYNILVSDEVYEQGITGTAHFFPAWMFLIMDNDGNSYKEQGMEFVEWERKKKKDKSVYKTQMPLTPSEAFTIGGKCPFNVEKLEMQMVALVSCQQSERMMYGRFEWVYRKDDEQKDIPVHLRKRVKPIGVRWVPRPSGKEYETDTDGNSMYPWCIVEHPDIPHISSRGKDIDYTVMFDDPFVRGLYKGGMDPYNKDEASESAYSKGCFVIAKGYHKPDSAYNIFPARLTWRPHKKELFYEQCVMAQMYYGHCKVLIEWSNDAPFDWYKNNGWEFLLKERPMITYAEMIESTVQNKYGIDPATKHVWEGHYASYIEDYFHCMADPKQVERALAYRKTKKYNDDEMIAYMLAWEHTLDDNNIGIIPGSTGEQTTDNDFGFGWVQDNRGGIHRL